jgi:hypothetical protein
MPNEEVGQEPRGPESTEDKSTENKGEASPSAPPPALPPNPPQPSADENDSYEHKKYRLERKTFVVAIATLILLFIYTGIAGYQAYQSWSALRLDQRAWVGVTNIANISIEDGKSPAFSVIVSNSGRTPALHTRVHIGIEPTDTSNLAFFVPVDPVPPTRESVVAIQPNQATVISAPPDAPPIPTSYIQALKAGTGTAFVYGVITYEDIFGTPHRTTFCALIVPDLHNWQWYSDYNEAN